MSHCLTRTMTPVCRARGSARLGRIRALLDFHPRRFWSQTKTPESTDQLRARTLIQEGNRMFQSAVQVSIMKYEEAMEQNPKSPVPYVKRAWAYLEIDDPDQALEDCEKALSMDSLSVEALHCKAQAFLKAEKLDKALEASYAAIDLTSPKDSRMSSLMKFAEELRTELAKKKFVETKGESMEELKKPNDRVPSFEAVQARMAGRDVEEPTTPVANTPLSSEQEKILQEAAPRAENKPELEKLQMSLSMKMQKMGGEDFFQMMQEMSSLPAVQDMQAKVQRGEQPSMSEYWALMKDERFRNFSLRMRGIEGIPELQDVLEQLKVGNWQRAFELLDSDDVKLDKFMKGFSHKQEA